MCCKQLRCFSHFKVKFREALSLPVETDVGYGRIHAWWLGGTAVWTSDYMPDEDIWKEDRLLTLRLTNLFKAFKNFKLFILDPTVEVVEPLGLDIDDAGRHDLAQDPSYVLRVSTHILPYVDPTYVRPIVGLGLPPPTEHDIERSLVLRSLKAGGRAIYNCYGSSIPASPTP
jgi:hypothetical protein